MTDYIKYDSLTQAAMRGVVREALRRAAATGRFPGDHHFYITFRTRAPGVKIADHLVQRFPDDMTIVIQHQFWDFDIQENHFEVVLKFSGVPQHLHIPFSAILRFVDPSVNFGLSFENQPSQADILALPTEERPAPAEAPGAPGVINLDAYRRK